MKKIILLQPSLRKNSLTAEILQEFKKLLVGNAGMRSVESNMRSVESNIRSSESNMHSENYEIETIDLQEKELEFCDGRELSAYNPDLREIYEKLKSADIIILWFPVYHYGISGVLKNLLDICGEALTGKKVWVIVSALLPDCHMAYEHFFESFEKKYSIERIKEVPYILNWDFNAGRLGLLGKGKLQKLVKIL